MPIPGTLPQDRCLLVNASLWKAFQELSLWVEALCIHQWCLFTETVRQPDGGHLNRGAVYHLLTARPGNRRPLTWEHHQIDLLLKEGIEFICPWTEKRICNKEKYDIDHLIPVSVYPINELWNLVPADPYFNSHQKREKLPSPARLARAEPYLAIAYSHYQQSGELNRTLKEDTRYRFSGLREDESFATTLAGRTALFITQVAESRSLARFE